MDGLMIHPWMTHDDGQSLLTMLIVSEWAVS